MIQTIVPFDIYPNSEFSSYEDYFDHVSQLPKSMRSVLISVDTAEFINSKIGDAFKLSEEKIFALTQIVRDVLIGTLFIGDMAQALTLEVEIDSENAKKISDLIVGQLFAPAIEDIKKIQREKFADRLSGKPVSQTTPSSLNRPVPAQAQTSQTINLRQSSNSVSGPQQQAQNPAQSQNNNLPRPSVSQSQPPKPSVNQPASGLPQQPQPQKVFKMPDLGPLPQQNQVQNSNQKNVLDLRNQ